MKPVLFVGDMNVDLIMPGLESFPQKDKEIACRGFEIVMGSSAAISACHFSLLGGRANFCGLYGNDPFGEYMYRGLRQFGVDVSRTRKSENVSTGVTVSLLYGDTRSQVTHMGTIEAFDESKLISDSMEEYAHIHFAGVYLQHRFRPRILELLGKAREKGVTSSLDPQWDASEKWAYMESWLPLLTYLFLNEDEACSITGTRTAHDAEIMLVSRGANPIIKLGAEGALVEGKHLQTRKIDAVDTTGAGDSFTAAFLHSVLYSGSDSEEAAEMGNRLAATTCTYHGGIPNPPKFVL